MTESPIRSDITRWLNRNDREFAEETKEHEETDKRMAQNGMPPEVLAKFAEYDQGRHERNQLPLGMFFDAIHGRRDGQNPTAYQLFVAAEVGMELLCEAICRADDDDNVEFFVRAYERWGEVVDVVLEECGLATRNSRTGQARASR